MYVVYVISDRVKHLSLSVSVCVSVFSHTNKQTKIIGGRRRAICVNGSDRGAPHRNAERRERAYHYVHQRMERAERPRERYREDAPEGFAEKLRSMREFDAGTRRRVHGYARQRVTEETMEKLYALARRSGVKEKINAMFSGNPINSTENRAVLHVATEAPRSKVISVEESNVVPGVHEVLDKIKDFSDRVRNGEWVGHTGLPLTDVVCVGIGGSFLGPLFVHGVENEPSAAANTAPRENLVFS